MTQVQGGGGAGNGTIATARWQGGLRPPAQVVLDGSSFKSDCRPEDVESREMKPAAEGASAPQGGGPEWTAGDRHSRQDLIRHALRGDPGARLQEPVSRRGSYPVAERGVERLDWCPWLRGADPARVAERRSQSHVRIRDAARSGF